MTANVMLIPMLALTLPIVLVPAVLALRHARIERELEHAERMKALELGRTLPRDAPFWTPLKAGVAIGAGVPVGVFGLALLADGVVGPGAPNWIAAGLVGVSGVIAGTYLVARCLTHPAPSRSSDDPGLAKSFVEDDAYDVVASRGAPH